MNTTSQQPDSSAAPSSNNASSTSSASSEGASEATATRASQWPLWEVFVRSKAGLDHKHCGSLHAVDGAMALQLARDVYTRRQEGTSVWVVRSDQIVASDPRDKSMLFDPADDKIYRHPTFYALPDSLNHM